MKLYIEIALYGFANKIKFFHYVSGYVRMFLLRGFVINGTSMSYRIYNLQTGSGFFRIIHIVFGGSPDYFPQDVIW